MRLMTRRAVSLGMAKPSPCAWSPLNEPPKGLKRPPNGSCGLPVSELERTTAVLMPMTLPLRSTSGPPLLPWLIAASVCRMPVSVGPLGSWRVRPTALMMPSVTEFSKDPSGLPMASTVWPGCLERVALVVDTAGLDRDHRRANALHHLHGAVTRIHRLERRLARGLGRGRRRAPRALGDVD